MLYQLHVVYNTTTTTVSIYPNLAGICGCSSGWCHLTFSKNFYTNKYLKVFIRGLHILYIYYYSVYRKHLLRSSWTHIAWKVVWLETSFIFMCSYLLGTVKVDIRLTIGLSAATLRHLVRHTALGWEVVSLGNCWASKADFNQSWLLKWNHWVVSKS